MNTKYNVYAIGKTGTFRPYTDREGGYPLHSIAKKKVSGKPMNHPVNKESIPSLDEAIRSIQEGTHHWRLRCAESGQGNLFAPKSIHIERL